MEVFLTLNVCAKKNAKYCEEYNIFRPKNISQTSESSCSSFPHIRIFTPVNPCICILPAIARTPTPSLPSLSQGCPLSSLPSSLPSSLLTARPDKVAATLPRGLPGSAQLPAGRALPRAAHTHPDCTAVQGRACCTAVQLTVKMCRVKWPAQPWWVI